MKKATQGTSYKNTDFEAQCSGALSAGRLLGVYHYVGGSNAVAEADFFCDTVVRFVGRAVLVVDWESIQNDAWQDEGYLDAVVARIVERTGVPPMIYASLSVFPWDMASSLNCGAWVAQYADMEATDYQDEPWNEGAYSCAIRQYSSCGRLPGWGGNLDLNKAYLDPEGWMAYATAGGKVSCGSSSGGGTGAPHGSAVTLVAAVLAGQFGNGEARRLALGSRYDEIQGLVNHVLGASAGELANEVIEGFWGNGGTRKAALGPRYDEVQAEVNRRLL